MIVDKIRMTLLDLKDNHSQSRFLIGRTRERFAPEHQTLENQGQIMNHTQHDLFFKPDFFTATSSLNL